MVIIDWDNTVMTTEPSVGNLFLGAQGPRPGRLLCKSDRHNLKVSDQYLKIFSHLADMDVMLSGGRFVTLTGGRVQRSPDCQVMTARLR